MWIVILAGCVLDRPLNGCRPIGQMWNVQMSVSRSDDSSCPGNMKNYCCTGREGFGYAPTDLLQNRRFLPRQRKYGRSTERNADRKRSRPTFRFLSGTRSMTDVSSCAPNVQLRISFTNGVGKFKQTHF